MKRLAIAAVLAFAAATAAVPDAQARGIGHSLPRLEPVVRSTSCQTVTVKWAPGTTVTMYSLDLAHTAQLEVTRRIQRFRSILPATTYTYEVRVGDSVHQGAVIGSGMVTVGLC